MQAASQSDDRRFLAVLQLVDDEPDVLRHRVGDEEGLVFEVEDDVLCPTLREQEICQRQVEEAVRADIIVDEGDGING